MKAFIVKEIKIETKELPERQPFYREAVYQPLMATAHVGEYATTQVNAEEITYERMSIINPETKVESNYFVRLDERNLWNDLITVSDGFINSKINDGVQKWKDGLKIPRPSILQTIIH